MELTTVMTYSVQYEAEMARSLLEESGIEAYMADENLVGINALYGPAIGGIKLQVPADQAEKAREILQQKEPPRPNCVYCGSEDTRPVFSFGAVLENLTQIFFSFTGGESKRDKFQCQSCGNSFFAISPGNEQS